MTPTAMPLASTAALKKVNTKPAAVPALQTPTEAAKQATAETLKETHETVSAQDVNDAQDFFAQALQLAADNPPDPVTATTDPVALPSFVCKTDPQENDTEILWDDAIFPDLLSNLSKAEKRIQISYFLLGGDIGMSIAKVLAERAEAGVDVQIMLDPGLGLNGPTATGIKKVFDYLRTTKATIKFYPLALFGPMPNLVQKKFQINHNKVAVIDTDLAYIGSMNLDDNARINHDLLLRIKGPTGEELSQMLDADWAFGNDPAATMKTKAVGDVRLTQTAPQEKNTKETLLKAFAEAKTSIHVAMYEFGDMDVAQGLIDAYKRGVDVRVIMDPAGPALWKYGTPPGMVPNGMPNILPAREFLKAGMQVHWFVPWRHDMEMHVKAVSIDNKTLIAGSTNWTTNSFTRWREAGFVLQGASVDAWETEYNRLWTSCSKRLDKLTFKEQMTAKLVDYMNKHDLSYW